MPIKSRPTPTDKSSGLGRGLAGCPSLSNDPEVGLDYCRAAKGSPTAAEMDNIQAEQSLAHVRAAYAASNRPVLPVGPSIVTALAQGGVALLGQSPNSGPVHAVLLVSGIALIIAALLISPVFRGRAGLHGFRGRVLASLGSPPSDARELANSPGYFFAGGGAYSPRTLVRSPSVTNDSTAFVAAVTPSTTGTPNSAPMSAARSAMPAQPSASTYLSVIHQHLSASILSNQHPLAAMCRAGPAISKR